MLDIKKIREETVAVKDSLMKRGIKVDFKKIIKLDDQRKKLIVQNEDLKAERNKFSKSKPDAAIIKQMKSLGEKIKDLETDLDQVQSELDNEIAALPNIVADDVVAGGKENNKIIGTFKTQPKLAFKFKNHVDLATELGLIDYPRAVKMSGSGFWAYTGDGALLEWALLNYFVDYHRQNNYQFIIPPFLLTEKSAYTSGHLPKFREDLFWTQNKLCLNATSEMMLGNYHRDEILPAEKLPLKYFAYSTCFRREAGSYRAEERGMVRGHQFNKIEMFQFTKPENSWQAFSELLKHAQKLVEGLELHYNTVQLAAGDCSAAMAKTIDLEVWIPSMNNYKEVSSVSNALDYQARRGQIRFKDSDGKNKFVHTLNASGLATSRILPAILEQNQQADGSVVVPKVLQKYLGKKALKK
ncbi:MAG: serine--tRNA ligase [Candidatus Komeilibacteria bacterium RIFOXYC1_FULL_37_11]|uniref:Serine--tRNA ligase n=1 Tax=Candidatus Komeilibacteria bacterium RIFOXYC1_FULL_37_11 TaxID=1798555 RepID=A0A1G2C242_9BACT|nr:MAG: serine--tRNA ligase [Candidatus Komeilibacteria bacterium RIFOXYC1_FULL_37_11]OGY95496.1 MAG: serine--tRNA ligase [Candidatus Komeilibacteria bacterium RIFOXYD1_FULL_37_29]OGY97185.1 MAG: serine--tRNA ligase [Candidatus Komeilibacteria bacterium RIFOXYD2_FULL_37_8]